MASGTVELKGAAGQFDLLTYGWSTAAFGVERTVVTDDGRAIRLTAYRGAEASGTAMLDLVRKIEPASKLIAVAYRSFTG